MLKHVIPAALALILTLSAGSSYTPANPLEIGACPPSFALVGPFGFHPPADLNKDFFICTRTIVLPLSLGMITVVFDNAVPRRLGRRP